eukprot:1217561-Pyramimonas_sp.AAC.1
MWVFTPPGGALLAVSASWRRIWRSGAPGWRCWSWRGAGESLTDILGWPYLPAGGVSGGAGRQAGGAGAGGEPPAGGAVRAAREP